MGYRRSKEKAKAKREWAEFVRRNNKTIKASGLPEIITSSIDHWDDFLMHSYLDHHQDPMRFTVDHLTEEQYRAFRQLVESYFVAGYSYITPIALRDADIQSMSSRFDRGRG